VSASNFAIAFSLMAPSMDRETASKGTFQIGFRRQSDLLAAKVAVGRREATVLS
jgi:hypothetical protein